ncbi:bifunctional farnesyl-diphosphate farnesyltransferase/squalene synthase [Podila horticola]|nr:bifunctional farnesyl-diphosphate farnesyltransferase/squalene synthase [Podila horticola]
MASTVFASVFHPSEVVAIVQYKLFTKAKRNFGNDKNRERLYYHLNKISSSFAIVIQELDEELKDTDDMTIGVDTKIAYLKTFHKFIYEKGWNFTKNGPHEKDRQLLVEFDLVISAFLQLKPAYQAIIADITKRMGEGMAHYVKTGVSIQTIADYDSYCHFAAGLVGEGLSDMFSACGFESSRLDLSNSMGVFLQKFNIITDYLEDLNENRLFWPKEISAMYCEKLEDLSMPQNKEQALRCLHHMIFDAMGHVKDVLDYLGMIKHPSCFKFCAIPQVIGIATLNMLCSNYKIFKRENIKIRKGEALWLMKESTKIDTVAAIFRIYAQRINNKSTLLNLPLVDMSIPCGEIALICESRYPASTDELRRLQAGVMAGFKGNVSAAAGVITRPVNRKNTCI